MHFARESRCRLVQWTTAGPRRSERGAKTSGHRAPLTDGEVVGLAELTAQQIVAGEQKGESASHVARGGEPEMRLAGVRAPVSAQTPTGHVATRRLAIARVCARQRDAIVVDPVL